MQPLFWRCFLWALLCGVGAVGAQAQLSDSSAVAPRLYTGYGLHFSYNLYSWNRHPSADSRVRNSSGQVLNVLPGVGGSWWVGDLDRWSVSVSAEIEWLPLQVSLRTYEGLGAWRLPLMARAQVPIWKQQSLWVRLSVGAGAQWERLMLYDRPAGSRAMPTAVSGVVEFGLHLSAVGTRRERVREVVLFSRFGAGNRDAQSLHVGLRLGFWNRLRKTKA